MPCGVQISVQAEPPCTKLIARANEHGGEDNVTAVLIKIEDMDGAKGGKARDADLDGETTNPGAGARK